MEMSIDFTAITKILNVLFIMISYCISLNFFVYVL